MFHGMTDINFSMIRNLYVPAGKIRIWFKMYDIIISILTEKVIKEFNKTYTIKSMNLLKENMNMILKNGRFTIFTR